MSEENILVIYCDGSARPTNPGFGGYGLFGYTLKTAKRPSKSTYPISAKYKFTRDGITVEKDKEPFETTSIVEYIGALNGNETTNNQTELYGLHKVLEIARETEGLTKVIAYIDSKYVVQGFNEYLKNWIKNGWSRRDGKPISHKDKWLEVSELGEKLRTLDIEIDVRWVKGHSDSVGNNLADLYASVGSNYSRLNDGKDNFTEEVLYLTSTYKDFKSSTEERDIIYFFKDLFFSSDSLNDDNFCFLSSSEDETQIGKKDTASIFLVNHGYVPKLVNEVKEIFRAIPRNYIISCCAKLNRLTKDKALLRLTGLLGMENLLTEVDYFGIKRLHLVNDKAPFVLEHDMQYPYKVDASVVFNSSLDILKLKEGELDNVWSSDVTDLFIKEGKLIPKSNDKHIEVADRFDVPLSFLSKLCVTMGKDFPPYLALKRIESTIVKVSIVLEIKPDSNYVSAFTIIETDDRTICSINITNKFTVLRKI